MTCLKHRERTGRNENGIIPQPHFDPLFACLVCKAARKRTLNKLVQAAAPEGYDSCHFFDASFATEKKGTKPRRFLDADVTQRSLTGKQDWLLRWSTTLSVLFRLVSCTSAAALPPIHSSLQSSTHPSIHLPFHPLMHPYIHQSTLSPIHPPIPSHPIPPVHPIPFLHSSIPPSLHAHLLPSIPSSIHHPIPSHPPISFFHPLINPHIHPPAWSTHPSPPSPPPLPPPLHPSTFHPHTHASIHPSRPFCLEPSSREHCGKCSSDSGLAWNMGPRDGSMVRTRGRCL